MNASQSCWLTRLVFQRGLGLVYLIAFVVAVNQFKALAGERGLLPAPLFLKAVSFRQSPTVFFLFPNDVAFAVAAWLGVLLSIVALTGISERHGTWFSMLIWAMLWMLYLSFVNAGQTFYAFGWESILLETGFFAMFLGARNTVAPWIMIFILRWVLFRVMFGAGLIKLRGDPCWWDLTCLVYHYETQPMPNPLSWYFHWAPEWTHKAGVLVNHFVEVIVPFGYFIPWRVSTIAGLVTIVFQLLLMLSGNLSWLNLLTIVIALTALDEQFLSRLIRVQPPGTRALHRIHQRAIVGVAVAVAILSISPVLNMVSPHQVMNFNYNPLHLVNTYGAFGGITRPRYEVVVEGTSEAVLIPSTKWREYAFKGKPGDLSARPPQIAPYHLRLDWLMWFAALSSYDREPWFVNFVAKLLQGDRATLALIKTNPFPDKPPQYVRALLYEYHFTTPKERSESGHWWTRQLAGTYFAPVSLQDRAFHDLLEQQGWL